MFYYGSLFYYEVIQQFTFTVDVLTFSICHYLYNSQCEDILQTIPLSVELFCYLSCCSFIHAPSTPTCLSATGGCVWDRPLNMVVIVNRSCLRSDCECEQMSVKSLCSIFTWTRISHFFLCINTQYNIYEDSNVKVTSFIGFQKTTESLYDVWDVMTYFSRVITLFAKRGRHFRHCVCFSINSGEPMTSQFTNSVIKSLFKLMFIKPQVFCLFLLLQHSALSDAAPGDLEVGWLWEKPCCLPAAHTEPDRCG